MKKVLALVMAMGMIILQMQPLFAAETRFGDTMVDSGNIVIGTEGGNELELEGNIQPTIISVIMPSRIPFDISKSLETQNKVVSPRVNVSNYSTVPVTVYVDNAQINLRQLNGTTWATSGNVGSNQVSVGMVQSDDRPINLVGTQWLLDGKQNTALATMSPAQTVPLYVTGAIGSDVPENRSFSVIATLVVRQGI